MRTLAAILLLLWASPAFAWKHGGASTPALCTTYTSDLANDGCQASPGGQMLDSGFFGAEWRNSGQTFVATPGFPATSAGHPPPYNVAGVDYPIGQIHTTASMADPATWSPGVGGCTYYAFTPGSTPPFTGAWSAVNSSGTAGFAATLYCNPTTAPLTISQYNFGPVGGHGCTPIFIASTTTQDIAITDNYFELTAECSNYYTIAGNALPPQIIGSSALLGVNLTFNSNTLIGHAYDPCCSMPGIGNLSSPPYPNRGVFGVSFKTSKTATFKYNWFQDFPGQLLITAGSGSTNYVPGSTLIENYNLFRDFQVKVTQGHGETNNMCCIGSITYRHNTILATTKVGAVWDAAINLGNSNGSHTSGDALVDGNVAIINGVYGANTTNSGATMLPSLTGHLNGGVYTLDTGGPVFPGSNFSVGATGLNFVAIHDFITGTGGPGSTYTIDCGVPGSVPGTVGCPYPGYEPAYVVNTPFDNAVTGGSLSGNCPGGSPTPCTETLTTAGNYETGMVVTVSGMGTASWNATNATLTAATLATSISFVNNGASGGPGTLGNIVNATISHAGGSKIANFVAPNFVDSGHGAFNSMTFTNNYIDMSGVPQGMFQQRGSDVSCSILPTAFSGNININNGASNDAWTPPTHGC